MTRSDHLAESVAPLEAVRPRTALAVSLLGFFMITLDTLIVNVALATIGRQSGGGTVGQQWIVDSYTLMFASLLLFAGNLADRVGAKRAFRIGLDMFTLASAACSLAPELMTLILARFLQGSAAALMLPASLALLREANPGRAAPRKGNRHLVPRRCRLGSRGTGLRRGSHSQLRYSLLPVTL
ncbi:MFS transporter [Arthrobacter globiformis]|uniref:MFS transporter n=1 Tax=Arthrobacter globiformis TaxID=1665 RepID=UPI001CB91021|nr:MFS transporter [Arthrobacter globiformis]